MTDTNRRFSIITLHPHWGQYIISQGMAFLISCALFLAAGHDSITYKMPFVVLGSIMTCIMLYGCLYIHKLSYIITSEQLIIQHGVLIRKSDYIELYRVVDFSENRGRAGTAVRIEDCLDFQRRPFQSQTGHIWNQRAD